VRRFGAAHRFYDYNVATTETLKFLIFDRSRPN
jgi:hypothetical protein